ncbi:AT-hook motif nuclear-localized protein 7-like [Cornus florida]|uniref:AT-hook motif nuclear-localized protein 7-like n=1 Tax=Cornus florida TaxID=4283 RepID=UPI00289E4A54|nr:AT-hook motif nuclear-localized protein 7-like [Cornus florida]XP_059651542.1 AT-hook motif nuclear-localized protein 7-like [Cornus florida]
MEVTEGISVGVTVIGAETPSNYHVMPRMVNSTEVPAAPAVTAMPVSLGMSGMAEKKKRGRPRKFGPDGTLSKALSPMPISSSVPPLTGDFSSGKQSTQPTGDFSAGTQSTPPTGDFSTGKSRGRPKGSVNKKRHRVEWENSSEYFTLTTGANFTPHTITVNAGEDITMKILSFSQQGPRAICIISATGSISNVTLRQPDSSGGTMTYEGRFDIVSLHGSFTPTEVEGSKFSRAGSLTISLAGPDGRLLTGVLGGLLVAASPVQLILGSFLPSNQNEPKPKKQKSETKAATTAPSSAANPSNVVKHQNSATQNLNFASPSTFGTDNWAGMQTMQGPGKSTTDINISLHGE